MSKVDPVKAAQRGLDSSSAATREKWHHLQHLQHKLDSLDKAKDGPSAIGPDDAGPSNGAKRLSMQPQILGTVVIVRKASFATEPFLRDAAVANGVPACQFCDLGC